MSLKYGLPLIFGSIGTFFIANMFEEQPTLELDVLPDEISSIPISEPALNYDNNTVFQESSPQHIPAPVYHAPVYHAPVYHAPIAPTPIYHPQPTPISPPTPIYKQAPMPAPMPAYEPPVQTNEQPKPVVLQPAPLLPKIKPKRVSTVSTQDPLSIKESLDLEKSKEAAAKEALRVVTAAKKRAEELRNPAKPPEIPASPNKLIVFPPLAVPKVLPTVVPTVAPKADIRLRGYSETDANPATLPPIGKIKPINIDAMPLSPVEIPKIKVKQDGGNRKLKNLARGYDRDDPYDRY